MSLSDANRLYYEVLWVFSRTLRQKTNAYKTEETELLFLIDCETELRSSIHNPSAWCSIPDAYDCPGNYAFAEFDEYLKNQVKKYANEKEKIRELAIANAILDEWHNITDQYEDAIFKAHTKSGLEVISTQPALDTPISFYQAARFLSDKLKTPIKTIEHELVGWICGEIYVPVSETPDNKSFTVKRELKAFSRKSLISEYEFDAFPYPKLSENNSFEYLAYFQGCYFSQSDIENFNPEERYISGHAMIERWLGYCGSRLGVVAKVVSCGRDKRLYWFHPFYLTFGASF